MTDSRGPEGNDSAPPDQDTLLSALARISAGYFHLRLAETDRVSRAVNKLMDDLENQIEQNQRNMLRLCERNDESHALNLELERKVETIQTQREAITELSTPVLEVWDGVLVMPLIGTVDAERARQIMESLLESVEKSQAAVVIIDLTGVPVIDTLVSEHLFKTIDAANMLGAEVICTGISPANAQIIVKLGVDVDRVNASGSLKAGLKQALQMSGLYQRAP